MLIYESSVKQFVRDVRENTLTDIILNSFQLRFGYRPDYSEITAWQNSLTKVRDLLEIAELTDNHIALEYEVPYSQNRIDCLLFGKGQTNSEHVVLIELKQWTSVQPTDEEGNFVETYTGRGSRVVAHPSQQVKGYTNYLKGFVTEFESHPPLYIYSCSYCHNYAKQPGQGIFDPKYEEIINEFPVYTKEDTKIIASKLKDLLQKGDGFEIFNRFMQSPVRPTRKLLDNVASYIKNEAVFSLLNEQIVAKNLIWSKFLKAKRDKEKSVIIVHGGPGTGKSLIAINLLAQAAGKGRKVFYGCKSKPFTEGLRKLVGKDAEILFSNLYRFVPSKIKENELDLLLIDEAHRIEKNSNHQYTKKEDRSDMPQVEQLIRCSKVTVFFIDDKQNVRSQEIGHSDMIRSAASNLFTVLREVTLKTQYRCMGSNDYLLWLESVLGYSDEKRILEKNEIFDFKIFDSPQELYNVLLAKEKHKANSARMMAGFCWPWSKNLDKNGYLVKDVRIGNFALPWETHGDITKPPKGYVKWYEWAYRPEGIKQVGCIYTAQGFEFDYAGVIIGDDLIYNEKTDRLTTDISATRDPTLRKSATNFDIHVRNIYRTLLSRGMKGCYVYFTNKETEAFFRKRIEQ
jgi:uncharacterized protein